ncbi:MAG TPA: hypothetical protein VGB18_03545 [Candidatus Thermoplasmatota archaeon]
MSDVRCPHCKAEFQGEASVDGSYRIMRCPECDYPMTDLILPFLRSRESDRPKN